MSDLLPLSMLRVGQTAHIGQVVGLPDHVKRLAELGMREGADVRVVQSGSPCIVQIDGQRLAFRDTDLLSVLVRPAADAAPVNVTAQATASPGQAATDRSLKAGAQA